ncbi:MAG: hypothetical protein EBR20_08375 [Bacteroidetes bacterium]|nr:hypothetical protein [Bacteroidota bacterium]
MRILTTLFISGVLFVSLSGCDETREHIKDTRTVEKEVERTIERGAERAEREIERVRKRIERRVEEKKLTEEDVEDIRRDVKESLSTGLSRVGRLLDEIGTRIEENADVEVIDFAVLDDFLPSSLLGMDRVEWSKEEKSALGMRFSKLEARYEAPSGTMEIAVVDLGTMKGLAGMGFDLIDRNMDQSDQEHLRHAWEYKGWPGYVSVDADKEKTEVQGVLIVKERIVIAASIEGEELTREVLVDLLDALKIQRLEKLLG